MAKSSPSSNPPRCAARVYHGRIIGGWPCRKPAGHGPGGAFCKLHARTRERVEPTLTVWVIKARSYAFDMPEPVRVREVGSVTFIDATGRRKKLRDSYEWHYRTEAEALTALQQQLTSRINLAKETLREALKLSARVTKRHQAIAKKGGTR